MQSIPARILSGDEEYRCVELRILNLIDGWNGIDSYTQKIWNCIDLLRKESQYLIQIQHAIGDHQQCTPHFLEFFEYASGIHENTVDFMIFAVELPPNTRLLSTQLSNGKRFTPNELHSLFNSLLNSLLLLSTLSPPITPQFIDPSRILTTPHNNILFSQIILFPIPPPNSNYSSSSSALITSDFISNNTDSLLEFDSDSLQNSLYSIGCIMLRILSGVELNSNTNLSQFFSTISSTSLNHPILSQIIQTASLLTHPNMQLRPTSIQQPLHLLNSSISSSNSAPSSSIPSDKESTTSKLVNLEQSQALSLDSCSISSRVISEMKIEQQSNQKNSKNRSKRIGESIQIGTFTAVWLWSVGVWTTSALASGGISVLFSLPFWYAGAQLTRKTVDTISGKNTILSSDNSESNRVGYWKLDVRNGRLRLEEEMNSELIFECDIDDVENLELESNQGRECVCITLSNQMKFRLFYSLSNDEFNRMYASMHSKVTAQKQSSIRNSSFDDDFFD